MLDQIPPEIISQIALHVSLSSPSFTAIPPINLLLASRSIHDAISPKSNPRLYGRLFRATFDSAAVERRMRQASSGGTIHHPVSSYVIGAGSSSRTGSKRRPKKRARVEEDKLTARQLAKELQRRVECLSRLKGMKERRDVSELTDDDLWIIYFMLIENDGKNVEYLIGPRAIAHLPTLLDLYHEQHLLTAAVEPGYPAETVGRSLAMWVAWLVGGAGPVDETPEQREERMFVLRPYVFAAQQYQLYFAPWVLPDLPLTGPVPETDNSNPFVADLSPKSRLVTVQHYGRDLEICPPFLAHAAILRFFYRRPGEDLDDDLEVAPPFMAMEMGSAAGVRVNEFVDGMIPGTEARLPSGPSTRPPTRPPSPSSTQHFLISNSAVHDRDFTRLKACYDPSITRGLRPPAWRGTWDGSWEGTFSFFDFDAFREMLAGHARALYEGPYGEQAQVWRIKETYVRKKGWVRPVDSEESESESDTDENRDKGKGRAGLPLSGPMVNAGFPASDPPNTFANLASAAAEAETLQETIRQQIEAIDGYEAVPAEELDEMLALDDGGEAAGLEMLLTGTGHSAWGKFILKGRVRGWDGMASLVKEYAPDSRGKWIYRGYVLAGDVFVGRWRDTYTPETFVGYEGTFILNRR
ncbi:hypothetical protein IAU60_001294 [Kwoniella sp. DSM 27419]